MERWGEGTKQVLGRAHRDLKAVCYWDSSSGVQDGLCSLQVLSVSWDLLRIETTALSRFACTYIVSSVVSNPGCEPSHPTANVLGKPSGEQKSRLS